MAAYRLEHVGIVIPPEKREETMQFYQSVFGWQIVREMPGVAFVGDGSGGRIEFLFNDKGPMAPPNHLAFSVSLDEFDSLMEKIKATGAPVRAARGYARRRPPLLVLRPRRHPRPDRWPQQPAA